MKSVLISIQPYYVFLIIARLIGWHIPENKTVEVRKNFPQDPTWDKFVHIYCSKNRKSFNRIPAKYQPLMARFLGKVIGEFVCDKVETYDYFIKKPLDELIEGEYRHYLTCGELDRTCLSAAELEKYLNEKDGYGWHISDLAVYDTPKKLSAFSKVCSSAPDAKCYPENCERCPWNAITRPPQNWCYAQNWCRKTQGA